TPNRERNSASVHCVHGFQLFNLDASDSVTVHFFNRVTVTFILESFLDSRNLLQLGEHEASQCLEAGVARKRELVLRFQITDVSRPLEYDRNLSISYGLLCGSSVVFVLDFTDYLLQYVFNRHHAGSGTELVHDHGHVTTP